MMMENGYAEPVSQAWLIPLEDENIRQALIFASSYLDDRIKPKLMKF